jgi:pimeloyl-ACP methyl ester carboxylesterase
MKTSIKLGIAALVFSIFSGSISNAYTINKSTSLPPSISNSLNIKNIVLVHGAFVDGSGWKPVYNILVKKGYHVSVVQQPLITFEGDVAAVKRIIAQQNGPCILVAHSYGGAIITTAGNDPKVAGLVYIAAHAPDSGESEAGNGKLYPSAYKSLQRARMDLTISTHLNFMWISRQIFQKSKRSLWPTHRCLQPTLFFMLL